MPFTGKERKKSRFILFTGLVCLFWTVVIFVSLVWNFHQLNKTIEAVAKTEARTGLEKDILYRRWNSMHGGLYAPITDKTPPNPFLEVAERDIQTPSGRRLTLINPAYMTRQVHELEAKGTGVQGHLTSLKPISPGNAPDAWEAMALRAFEKGEAEVSALVHMKGGSYMRLMRPFLTERECLKCHARQGYREGDIRGGLSISVPMEPLYARLARNKLTLTIGHGIIWVLVLIGITLGSWRIKSEIDERNRAENATRESEQHLLQIFNFLPDAVVVIDNEGKVQAWNHAMEEMTGIKSEAILTKGDYEYGIPFYGKRRPLLANLVYQWDENIAAQYKSFHKKGDRFLAEQYHPLLGKDGIYALLAASPIRDSAGKVVEVIESVRDITDRKKWEELRDRYDFIVNSVNHPMSFINREYVYEAVNDKWCNILQESRKNAIGKTVSEVWGHEIFEEKMRPNIDRCFGGEEVSYEAFMELGKLGERYCLTGIYPYFNDQKEVTHVVVVINDITDRKEMEEALQKRIKELADTRASLLNIMEDLKKERKKAEEATQAKSQFLASMSHEIRTPMNAIIGLGELALRTDLSPKQRDYLNKIKFSARSLLGIINDILDFSKIEAGKLDFEEIPFNLENVLKNVANLLAERAYKKGLELLFKTGPKLPKGLVGDPLRLGQVLTNLGNNAIKFTEQGEVEIEATQLERDTDRVTLQFLVRDTGIGINEEEQKKLFKAFSQADVSTTRRFGGTGLGLAISKRLVEIMGGEIWVDSTPGQGSTFGFTVVMGLSDPSPLHPLMRYKQLHNMRVLVVDNNEEARSILRSMLESMSFRAETVESGPVAIVSLEEADQEDPYRLVLMDWHMPGMDGYEAIRRIRNDPKISNQPKLILVTAYGHERVLKEGEQMNLDGLLLKPVTPSILFDAMVEAFSKNAGCEEDLDKSRAEKEGGERVSLEGNRVLLVEDNKINQQVAREILEQADIQVGTADNGREALEALKTRVYDAVLMDVQMPVMDGYEATRRIRREPGFKELPIIAMTAGAMAGDKEKALNAGMNDFVSKPIDIKEFFATLSRYLQSTAEEDSASPRDGAAFAQTPDISLPDVFGLDVEAGLHCLGGNRALYRKLLASFARNYAETHNKVGQELTAGRVEAAEALVHALKGVAGNIGATEVFQRAQALDAELKKGRIEDAPQLLQALSKALAPLLEALAGLEALQSPSAPSAANKPFDAQEVRAVLKRLDELLAQSDLEAKDVLGKLQGYLANPEQDELIQQIDQQLSEYDFKAARKSLAQLSDSIRGI